MGITCAYIRSFRSESICGKLGDPLEKLRITFIHDYVKTIKTETHT